MGKQKEMVTDLPTITVAEQMAKLKLAPDKDKAYRIIMQSNGGVKSEVVTFDEFLRIFCKGMFKDALMNIVSEFDKMSYSKHNLPLSVKITEYQRGLLLGGVLPGSSKVA
jgi:hypothetical protein